MGFTYEGKNGHSHCGKRKTFWWFSKKNIYILFSFCCFEVEEKNNNFFLEPVQAQTQDEAQGAARNGRITLRRINKGKCRKNAQSGKLNQRSYNWEQSIWSDWKNTQGKNSRQGIKTPKGAWRNWK